MTRDFHLNNFLISNDNDVQLSLLWTSSWHLKWATSNYSNGPCHPLISTLVEPTFPLPDFFSPYFFFLSVKATRPMAVNHSGQCWCARDHGEFSRKDFMGLISADTPTWGWVSMSKQHNSIKNNKILSRKAYDVITRHLIKSPYCIPISHSTFSFIFCFPEQKESRYKRNQWESRKDLSTL